MAGIKSFKIKNFLKKKDSGREKNEVNNENLNNNNNQPADNRTCFFRKTFFDLEFICFFIKHV